MKQHKHLQRHLSTSNVGNTMTNTDMPTTSFRNDTLPSNSIIITMLHFVLTITVASESFRCPNLWGTSGQKWLSKNSFLLIEQKHKEIYRTQITPSIVKLWLLISIALSTMFEYIKDVVAKVFGSTGASGFGSNSTAEQVTEGIANASHLTAIVTGATSGIGVETARVLAKRGVRVLVPARDLEKGEELRERIQKENPKACIVVMEMDLGSFKSVRRFCSKFLSMGLPLNILINNAGRYCRRFELTEDKFEVSFATNYLGHYLLTEALLEKMLQTAEETGIEGRIINVSSVVHSWVKKGTFQFYDTLKPKHYRGTRAYAQSKLANILHAKEIARQLKARKANVTINAVHPGIVKTGITRDHKSLLIDFMFLVARAFLKSLPQAASTACYVALSPQVKGVSGEYFVDCNITQCLRFAESEDEARELWKQTRILISKRIGRMKDI